MTTPILPTPAPLDRLSPIISPDTLCLIEQKILPAYQTKLINEKTKKNQPITNLTTLTAFTKDTPTHRTASELYQHLFWLDGLSLTQNNAPIGTLSDKIIQDFGSFDKFVHEFTKPLNSHDGIDIRWLWLALKDDKLITLATKTENILTLAKPILACNLWQHAYFLDYFNRVDDYINAFFDRLVNWQKCEERYQELRDWGSF